MKTITYAEIHTLSDEGVKPIDEMAKHIPKGVIKRISIKNENELVFGAKKLYMEHIHKSTEGWETLINSLLDSGLIMTDAWPLHTEMKARLAAQESAALASSIYIEARKLAQSCGIDLVLEWNRSGFISKEKEFIRVLGPQDRKLEELEGSSKLIDVLHRVLLLWEKSKRSEMISLLQESGFGKSEAFYRVAQAVSESLTLESKEKKLLDRFLAGRERLKKEVKKGTSAEEAV